MLKGDKETHIVKQTKLFPFAFVFSVVHSIPRRVEYYNSPRDS